MKQREEVKMAYWRKNDLALARGQCSLHWHGPTVVTDMGTSAGLVRMTVLVAQLCLTLCEPMNCSPPGSSVHGILKKSHDQEYWSGLPSPSPMDLPNPGIKPGSPALQAQSLSSEPPGGPLSRLRGPLKKESREPKEFLHLSIK